MLASVHKTQPPEDPRAYAFVLRYRDRSGQSADDPPYIIEVEDVDGVFKKTPEKYTDIEDALRHIREILEDLSSGRQRSTTPHQQG